MCKYCEIDERTDKAKRYIRNNQRVKINIIKHMTLEGVYYLCTDTNLWKRDLAEINYCPMCRKKLKRNGVINKC